MKGLSTSIFGGIITTALMVLLYYNFSWLMLVIVVSAMVTGALAAAVAESGDNLAGFLFGCSVVITVAIPLTMPIQVQHIYGVVLGFLSFYLFFTCMSEY
ncbi:MAG: hypothetical protein OIN66_08740 [Candidatus Methanoperedens sp.]|nr:hypothetical protein [Candidatus Methanoperedens sp.]